MVFGADASIFSKDQDAEDMHCPPSSQENQVVQIRLGQATQIWLGSESTFEARPPFPCQTYPSVLPWLGLAVPVVRDLFMPPRVNWHPLLLQPSPVRAPSAPPLLLHQLGALRHPAPLLALTYSTQ